MTEQEAWNECLKFIKDNIEEESFNTWFSPIKAISLDKHILTIQVPSLYYHEWIEGNYWKLLKSAINRVLGPEGKLEYKILVANSSMTLPPTRVGTMDNNINIPLDENLNKKKGEKDIINPFVVPGLKKINIQSQLKKELNFDTFIEGECNRLARAAGYSIATNPIGTTAFNPFFIYSASGLGKTHLAHAIGLETKVNFPDALVLYVDSVTFLRQYVHASNDNTLDDFFHFYQMLDMLIIDDIQFLAGKVHTQEMFFQIFNAFHQKHKQIIITADKSPAEIQQFDQRLLSRFKWGLAADLQSPDKETRTKIIRSKCYSSGIDIPDEVVEYLACRIVSNVREIEGAIITILAQSSLNKQKITVELAKQMIDRFVRNTSHKISIDYIQKVVCDHFGVSVSELSSSSRKRNIVQVRQTSMYFAKKYTDLSLAQIGAQCGNKDHATVLHACRTVDNLKVTDRHFKEHLEEIDKIIKNA